MIVRNPKFDFSKTTPNWVEHMEFAQTFNAMSMLFPPLERFLNRVMIMAKGKITGNDAESQRIRNDIDLFVRQEGAHYAIHTEYNKMLERHGYPNLPQMEAEMDESYRHLLKTKSLRYLTAHCEGFEILGPIFANVWLDEIGDLFEGGEPNAVAMWKWHISEEFEHRTVCYDVYNKLYGGYFYRLWVLNQVRKHNGDYIKKVMGYLLAKQWENMTEEQVAASKAKLEAVGKRIGRLAKWHMLKVFIPFYSPRRAKVPANYPAVLDEIARDYQALPA